MTWLRLKSYPFEFRYFLLPSIFVSLLSLAIFRFLPSKANPESFYDPFFILTSGGKDLKFGLAIILLFIVLALGRYIYRFHFQTDDGSRKAIREEAVKFLKSLVFIIVLFSTTFFASGAVILLLFIHVPVDRVMDASSMLVDLELKIFNGFPAYSVQNYPVFLEKALMITYKGLFYAWGITCALCLVLSKKKFRRFFASFLIFYVFCFVIWVLVPALAPGPLIYMHEVHGFVLPEEVGAMISNLNLNEPLRSYVHNVYNYIFAPDMSFFAVSSFPSAHAGWALIAVYFAILIYRPLALFYVPFLLLTAVSTFYLAQHYAIDAVAGILIAAIAIKLADRLISKDEEKGRGESFYYSLDVLNGISRSISVFVFGSKRIKQESGSR